MKNVTDLYEIKMYLGKADYKSACEFINENPSYYIDEILNKDIYSAFRCWQKEKAKKVYS